MCPACGIVLRCARILTLCDSVKDCSAILVGLTCGDVLLSKEAEAVLTGIYSTAKVEELRLIIICNKSAGLLIECTNPVVAVNDVAVYGVLGTVEEDVFCLRSVLGADGKHYYALPMSALLGISVVITLIEIATMLPFSHILGGINNRRAARTGDRGGNHHVICARIVPNEGVTELLSLTLSIIVGLGNNQLILNDPVGEIGVCGVCRMGKCNVLTTVVSVTVEVCTCGNNQPRKAVRTDTSAACPNTLGTDACGGNNRILYVFPMDHILTYDMSPADLRPIRTCRIVLIEHVVHTVVVEGRMGLVHPNSGRKSVVLGTVTVALVNRGVKSDVFPGKVGMCLIGIGVVIDRRNILGSKCGGEDLNLVEKAGDHLSLDTKLDLGANVCTYTERLLGIDNTGRNKLGDNSLIGLLAIEEEGDVSCLTVEGNGNVRPLVERKRVHGIVEAYYEVLAAFLVMKGKLNAPKAESSVAEKEALAHLDITLVKDGGETGMSSGIGLVAVINDVLKNSGCNPCGHGECRVGSNEVTVYNIVGEAVHVERVALYTGSSQRIVRLLEKTVRILLIEYVVNGIVVTANRLLCKATAILVKRIV